MGNQVAFVKSKSLCHLKELSFSQYHEIFDRASFSKFYNRAIIHLGFSYNLVCKLIKLKITSYDTGSDLVIHLESGTINKA